MNDLYKRITELLNQRPTSREFETFVEELREDPRVQAVGQESKFDFPNNGFLFTTASRSLFSAILHLDSPDTRSGFYKAYIGNLPCQISGDGSRESVQRKLGVTPTESTTVSTAVGRPRDVHDTYTLSSLRVSFVFDGISGKLSIVGIIKLPTVGS